MRCSVVLELMSQPLNVASTGNDGVTTVFRLFLFFCTHTVTTTLVYHIYLYNIWILMAKSKHKSSGNTSDKENESDHRCHWSSADDAILVNTLRKQKLLGFQAENGWKPQAWSTAADCQNSGLRNYGSHVTRGCRGECRRVQDAASTYVLRPRMGTRVSWYFGESE
jgi:hypothetical protein